MKSLFDLSSSCFICCCHVIKGYGTAAIIHKSSYTQNNPSTSPIQIGEGQNTSKSKLIPIATRLSPNRCHSESDLAELLNIQPGTGKIQHSCQLLNVPFTKINLIIVFAPKWFVLKADQFYAISSYQFF